MKVFVKSETEKGEDVYLAFEYKGPREKLGDSLAEEILRLVKAGKIFRHREPFIGLEGGGKLYAPLYGAYGAVATARDIAGEGFAAWPPPPSESFSPMNLIEKEWPPVANWEMRDLPVSSHEEPEGLVPHEGIRHLATSGVGVFGPSGVLSYSSPGRVVVGETTLHLDDLRERKLHLGGGLWYGKGLYFSGHPTQYNLYLAPGAEGMEVVWSEQDTEYSYSLASGVLLWSAGEMLYLPLSDNGEGRRLQALVFEGEYWTDNKGEPLEASPASFEGALWQARRSAVLAAGAGDADKLREVFASDHADSEASSLALIASAWNGQLDCARFASENGADEAAAGIALVIATWRDQEEIVEYLLAQREMPAEVIARALLRGAKAGRTNCVRLLVGAYDPLEFEAERASMKGWYVFQSLLHAVNADCARELLNVAIRADVEKALGDMRWVSHSEEVESLLRSWLATTPGR